MDLFRRKKKTTTSISTSSQEEQTPTTGTNPRTSRASTGSTQTVKTTEKRSPARPRQKRHSVGDSAGPLSNIFTMKKPVQKDLELPCSPHARSGLSALKQVQNDENLTIRVSKRRAPGPPKSSPKRHSMTHNNDRRILSSPSIAKTTVCSTEVFQDSHIGREVTSPASSISGRFLSVPNKAKKTSSVASSYGGGSSTSPRTPLGSVIQVSPGSVVHESAIFRKPVVKSNEKISSETDVQRSLNREPVLPKSRSSQDLPFVAECTTSLYADSDTIRPFEAPTTPEPDYDIFGPDGKAKPAETCDPFGDGFLSQAVCTWSSRNVIQWCRMKGFNDYAELFEGMILFTLSFLGFFNWTRFFLLRIISVFQSFTRFTVRRRIALSFLRLKC